MFVSVPVVTFFIAVYRGNVSYKACQSQKEMKKK